MRDPYEVLGLHAGASQAEVQDAYDKLLQVYNDQLQNDANMRRFVREKRTEIESAYRFLMDGSSSANGFESDAAFTDDGRPYFDADAQTNAKQTTGQQGWQTAGGNPYNNPFAGGNSDYQNQPYRSSSPFVANNACGPCSSNFCCQFCAAQLCFECCCDSACGC